MLNQPRPAVAIAILYRQGQLLLQLRDNIPGILYPGCWGLFGGHLEPEESPEDAMYRELLEEIHYRPPHLTFFDFYSDDHVIRHVFHAPLTVEMASLRLSEGWDMGLFSLEDIQRGDRYSERAEQVRPIGSPHQKLLLDFFETHRSLIAQLTE